MICSISYLVDTHGNTQKNTTATTSTPVPSPPALARALTLAQAVPRNVAPRALLPPAVYLPRPRTLPIQMTPTGRVCRHPRAEGPAHRLRAMFPARRRQQPVSQRAASIYIPLKSNGSRYILRSASGPQKPATHARPLLPGCAPRGDGHDLQRR